MKKKMLEKEPKEKEEINEEEEDQEEEEREAEKSDDLTTDDLQKSIDKLDTYVENSDDTSRKQILLEKAQSSDLNKSEQEELFKLLGGIEAPEKELSEEITKGLEENEDLQKALDVSDYLREQHSELTKALGGLSEYIEKSDNRQHEFNLLLARAVSETGKLAKSMDDRLAAFESQPARKPKSLGVNRPLEKSFAGQPVEGDQLSKSVILDAMEELMIKSVNDGRNGVTEDGISLDTAVAQYEQFNRIHPKVLAEVKNHIASKKGNGSKNTMVQ